MDSSFNVWRCDILRHECGYLIFQRRADFSAAFRDIRLSKTNVNRQVLQSGYRTQDIAYRCTVDRNAELCHVFVGLDAFEKLRKPTVSFVMSVRPSVCPPAWNSSVTTGRIFVKFDT